MKKSSYYIINGITVYRLIIAPILVLLILFDKYDLFKWLLPISFFTDLIDGYLARKFKVVSKFGARLDSIADDLTIVAAIVGLFVWKQEFVRNEIEIIIVLLSLYLLQTVSAFIRYHKISSFHTYAAKIAAVFQGAFLILIFFLPEPVIPLFYTASFFTTIDLVEEIILVILLPKWETNVKGLYWVMKRKNNMKKQK